MSKRKPDISRRERFVIRRRLFACAPLCALAPALLAQAQAPSASARDSDLTRYAPVTPGKRLRFPHDEGSHPAFRTEWWYVTGWLERSNAAPLGFQVTFFRTRPRIDPRNESAFSARQIIIAHAALSEASRGRLVHDQKVARAGFGLAGAEEGRTRVWLDAWSLTQEASSYALRIPARDFVLTLELRATQPPLLQGENGYSRKGPRPESASYYYSIPHLQVTGTLAESGGQSRVTGNAWLDHEWSSSYMDERAAGWDWIGINLSDGGALMAFRMRDKNAGTLWAGGAYRSASGARRVFAPGEVAFVATREWRSPRTGTRYPVAFRVRAGDLEMSIEALMDDQEHDTRASVGTVYWEGAVTAAFGEKSAGRGYLELTGYWQPMKL